MHSFTALFIVLVASVFRLAEASSGCDLSSTPWKFDKTGHSNQTLGDRSFWVHLPSTYKPDVPHPVVLSYHGSNSSSRRQEHISGFSQHGLTINKTGIIAVYPMAAYGPGKHGDEAITAWEGAPYAPPGVDDVSFTLNIIQALKDNLCVDPNRIYAAGKSEGGGFVRIICWPPPFQPSYPILLGQPSCLH
ncbi:hypothetical protein AcV5_008163 [Taiwanofungus camphoratus]|nr:hypothetical protein AcV5_008163 [Antrodia cinnamomea]